MIPARYAPILFGFVLSSLMSAIVALIATIRAVGVTPDLLSLWSGAWLTSWAVAFPTVLMVGPIARRAVALLVDEPPKNA